MVNIHDIELEDVRPLSRSDYDKLVELGTFQDERVELIRGMVVRMSPVGPPHADHVQRVMIALVRQLDPRAAVRVQSSFAASDESEPEPDIAVVPPGDYSKAHPRIAHLIVEVAKSSLSRDRKKAAVYAESGVPEYWIVNLVDDVVEVHRDAVRGAYTRVSPFRHGELVRLVEFDDVEIAVAEILRR